MKQGRILIVDDNKSILNALSILLQFEFEKVETISNPNLLMRAIENDSFDVILLDMNFTAGQNTGNEGIFWLRAIKKQYPDIEVVMITAYGDIELAVNSLKEGAADFILKPWDNEKLKATIKATLRLRFSNLELKSLKSNAQNLKTEFNRGAQFVIGRSAAMREVMEMAEKVAKTDANVLIKGENGTGKELIAKEIHRLSNRSNELFVLVDLSAITETLFESELFGHKKGSFTNAYEDRTGKFILASKGTLFLDEIGNIPMHLQSKLLTVLQTRVVTPVGSNKEVPIDIRLISATNKDINQMVKEDKFRQDLMFRINTIQVHIPPLRERPEDIKDLANHFTSVYGKKYDRPFLRLSETAIEILSKNKWPGNIRELQHAIEKAVILSNGEILGPENFQFGYTDQAVGFQPETIEEMEKKMIINALKRHNQNFTAVSSQLGITRQTLYNKLKKYGLQTE